MTQVSRRLSSNGAAMLFWFGVARCSTVAALCPEVHVRVEINGMHPIALFAILHNHGAAFTLSPTLFRQAPA